MAIMGVETGKIKWFDYGKGYGFILADNGDDIFFDIYAINDISLRYEKDNAVKFRRVESSAEKVAEQVRQI